MKAKYPEADLSGTVSEVYVNEGDSVSAGTQLLKIVADENIYIDFSFTYADSDDFYIGQTATVFINGFEGTLTGKVTAVSSSSAAVSILQLLRGQVHFGAVPLGKAYFGCQSRMTPLGPRILQEELAPPLQQRIAEAFRELEEFSYD